jgi:outer membrane immunogenic protein
MIPDAFPLLVRASVSPIIESFDIYTGSTAVGNFEIGSNLTTGSSIAVSNDTNSGWLVGAGIEWAFAANWSAKVEYNYLGLDDRTFSVPAGSAFLAGDTFTQSNRSVQMLKVGVNYRLNWGGY